ncbi:HD domain-containing protein [Pokkaliibacter sp. CJK22405]|uniref:HD domain-containing protein n=1 Tax=Pokkaliibacter sp. CJK22405 TaxID=3384615 RepID=UPI003985352D
MRNYPLLLQGFATDVAHDVAHIRRVVSTAKRLCEQEGAHSDIVEAASWLHDCVNLPKDHPERHLASRMSADKAMQLLEGQGFSLEQKRAIHHAIHAHSFSANVEAKTLEACIVQDADRLDALGAIGLARTFMVGGQLQRALYALNDPFCQERLPDDKRYGLDHFYTKLLLLEESFKTEAGRQEAKKRTAYMKEYLEELRREIGEPLDDTDEQDTSSVSA